MKCSYWKHPHQWTGKQRNVSYLLHVLVLPLVSVGDIHFDGKLVLSSDASLLQGYLEAVDFLASKSICPCAHRQILLDNGKNWDSRAPSFELSASYLSSRAYFRTGLYCLTIRPTFAVSPLTDCFGARVIGESLEVLVVHLGCF